MTRILEPVAGNPAGSIGAAGRLVFGTALLSVLTVYAHRRSPQATAETPQISIQKNYVAISVTIDAELKLFSELFANCLAEGQAWANKTNDDVAAELRGNRKAFRDGLKWFYDREYTLRSVVGRYISIARGDDWFDGGAHPNQHIDTILWDDTTPVLH